MTLVPLPLPLPPLLPSLPLLHGNGDAVSPAAGLRRGGTNSISSPLPPLSILPDHRKQDLVANVD